MCNGGNFTLHGQIDGLLIEGNTITQTAATGGCYGLSITNGYNTAEWFRNLTVRGNTITNVGFFAIVAHSAPNILIENNRVKNTQATYQIGIGTGAGNSGGGDDVLTNGVIRNNTVCFTQPASGSLPVRVDVPTTAVETGTVYRTGADAATGVCAF